MEVRPLPCRVENPVHAHPSLLSMICVMRHLFGFIADTFVRQGSMTWYEQVELLLHLLGLYPKSQTWPTQQEVSGMVRLSEPRKLGNHALFRS